MTLATLLASVTITMLPVGSWTLSGKCGDPIGGVYTIGTNEIQICDINKKQNTFTKYHELGHYFWFTKLDNKYKKEYEELYNKALKIGTGAFFRPYSMSKLEEDFADNFALMSLERYTNKHITKRVNKIAFFMRVTKILNN